MNFKQKAVMFLATGCFIGNISFATVTFGSILGLPLGFFLSKVDLSVSRNGAHMEGRRRRGIAGVFIL